MYARVTQLQADPRNIDTGVAGFRNDLLPAARAAGGFKGALLMVDRETGKTIGLTLWESEEASERGGDAVRAARESTIRAIGETAIPEVQLYEVVVADGI